MLDRRIGAQLYTVRDFCQNELDFDKTLGRLEKIGYKLIQVSGVGNMPAKNMRKIIDSHGMEVVCTHRSFDDFYNKTDEVIEYNLELGSPLAGIGSMPAECYESFDEIMDFIQKADKVAHKAKEAGLYFGHHNHGFEFVKFDGKYAIEHIIENTNPDEYKFILDVFWLAVAGINPPDYIRRLGERTMAVHFKDLKMLPDNNREMAEVTVGNLDWDKIITACDDAGIKWALVEQDVCPGDPVDSLEISYNALKEKGFR